jgi:hypothetical protein
MARLLRIQAPADEVSHNESRLNRRLLIDRCEPIKLTVGLRAEHPRHPMEEYPRPSQHRQRYRREVQRPGQFLSQPDHEAFLGASASDSCARSLRNSM